MALKEFFKNRKKLAFERYIAAQEREARKGELGRLREIRSDVRALQQRLHNLAQAVSERVQLPLLGTNVIRQTEGADWLHRPQVWHVPLRPASFVGPTTRTQIGDGLTLFHDCPLREMTLRQIRNTREQDFAVFGLNFDIFNFEGSFLSLAIELPQEAIERLSSKHILSVEVDLEVEKPIEMYVRANIKHGPNIDQVIRELDQSRAPGVAEFDLTEIGIDPESLQKIWLDLIFDSPSMNMVLLRDVIIRRRISISI